MRPLKPLQPRALVTVITRCPAADRLVLPGRTAQAPAVITRTPTVPPVALTEAELAVAAALKEKGPAKLVVAPARVPARAAALAQDLFPASRFRAGKTQPQQRTPT